MVVGVQPLSCSTPSMAQGNASLNPFVVLRYSSHIFFSEPMHGYYRPQESPVSSPDVTRTTPIEKTKRTKKESRKRLLAEARDQELRALRQHCAGIEKSRDELLASSLQERRLLERRSEEAFLLRTFSRFPKFCVQVKPENFSLFYRLQCLRKNSENS